MKSNLAPLTQQRGAQMGRKANDGGMGLETQIGHYRCSSLVTLLGRQTDITANTTGKRNIYKKWTVTGMAEKKEVDNLMLGSLLKWTDWVRKQTDDSHESTAAFFLLQPPKTETK